MGQTAERLHGLDALRGFALMLGVILHISMSFVPGDDFWLVNDHSPSYTMAGAYFTIHTFRMVLFFFIAGFFAQLSLQRAGVATFVRDRIKRIILPLAVGWIVIAPIMLALFQWGLARSYGPQIFDTPLGNAPHFSFRTLPLGHFWFLYLLALFYAGAMTLHRIVGCVDRKGFIGQMTDRVIRPVIESRYSMLVLCIPSAICFAASPGWIAWAGIQAPDHGLIPNHTAVAAYGLAFGVGWFVRRQLYLLDVWRTRVWTNLAIAASLTAGLMIYNGLAIGPAPDHGLVGKIVSAVSYGMAGWAWTFGLVGLALRYLSAPSAAARYLADASYWIYIVHMPIVVALQAWISVHDWAWYVKVALIAGLTLPPLLLSYHLFVRHTVIGEILNGKRAARPTLTLDPARAFVGRRRQEMA